MAVFGRFVYALRIDKLETLLGVRLCNRSTRDVALTSLGDLECTLLALSAFSPAFLAAFYIKKGRGVRI